VVGRRLDDRRTRRREGHGALPERGPGRGRGAGDLAPRAHRVHLRVPLGRSGPGRGVGTRLRLRHALPDAAARDAHVQGWRYQLAVFANVVCDALHAAAVEQVDSWFAAWSEPDAERRSERLATTVSPGIRFRDRFSLVEGLADLEPHLAAVHVFMPGSKLERAGGVRHCQGTVLADWVARGPDGAERGRGSNVFALGPDGRIEDVVGLWA
jgi:hypothetical protein